MASDPCLKMKVTSRPPGAWDWLLRFNLWDAVVSRLGGKSASAGDHLVVDTGSRLVDIKGDHLNLSGIRQGDSVEFSLDEGVDPGGATYVKGEVVMVQDAPDPKDSGRDKCDFSPRVESRLDRPIDPKDPVSDLVVRRAELFKAFRESRITQDTLKTTWDSLRNQALEAVKNGSWSYFEKQDLLQRLMEMAAFSSDEAVKMGLSLSPWPDAVEAASTT